MILKPTEVDTNSREVVITRRVVTMMNATLTQHKTPTMTPSTTDTRWETTTHTSSNTMEPEGTRARAAGITEDLCTITRAMLIGTIRDIDESCQ